MPPKKRVVADETADTGGDGAFRWTPENERALFVLTIERQLTTDDYHKIVEALPPGANYNGVRQRISKMRKEQRERFEELGWPLPDGTATKISKKTSTKSPKKRAATADKGEEGGDAEAESPTKKPRARKPKKETVKKEIDEEEKLLNVEAKDAGVKEELLEEGI